MFHRERERMRYCVRVGGWKRGEEEEREMDESGGGDGGKERETGEAGRAGGNMCRKGARAHRNSTSGSQRARALVLLNSLNIESGARRYLRCFPEFSVWQFSPFSASVGKIRHAPVWRTKTFSARNE